MPLRGFTGGASEVHVSAATVREALVALESAHKGATSHVLDERGELRSFVNVFVNQKNVKSSSGLDTPVPDGAVLSIVPAVAGGQAS
jgi:molybdopterin converting factor small subunit